MNYHEVIQDSMPEYKFHIKHKNGKTFSSNKFSLFKKNENILMTKNQSYSITTKPIQGHPEDMGY